jgi:hypothetical protein
MSSIVEPLGDEVNLTLKKAEALVLFDFLSRFSDHEKLVIEDQAERRVLWNLCCDLEKLLEAPFCPNYQELLQTARERVRDSKD